MSNIFPEMKHRRAVAETDQSESDLCSVASVLLSVYGHKERKTERERQRDREKLIVCEVQ